jgi:hypothetical protein
MLALVAGKMARDSSFAEPEASMRFSDKRLIVSFFHSAQIFKLVSKRMAAAVSRT